MATVGVKGLNTSYNSYYINVYNRFPDSYFPGWFFPGKTFFGKTIPVWSLSWKDVSRVVIFPDETISYD